MKYIIFTDIHLHTFVSSIDNDTRLPSRLVEQKNVLQQVIDTAIENEGKILFGGDLVHSVGKIPVEVLNVVYWFFQECQRCGIELYCAVGNHDMLLRDNGTSYHSVLTPFQDKQKRDTALEAMKIKFIDYDDKDYYNTKGYDIVIVHKQPTLVNKFNHKLEGVNWKELESNNRLLFFGHFHNVTRLSDKTIVMGCPMHLTKADAGEDKGCWIVDDKDWSVTFKKLQYTEIAVKTEEEKKEEEVVFEAKIKADTFEDILIEWLERQEKPKEYLDLIKDNITAKLQVVKPFFTGKIKNLTIKNLLSIEELDIDFKDGLNLIVGKNGSGKSSIGEILMWTLFESTTKQLSKTEIVRDRPTQQKDGSAELILDGEEPYIIKRSVKKGLEVYKSDVLLTDGMGKAQAQEFLETAILGFNKTVYMAACYFSQEQLTMLSQLGDADTTNMVTNLLGFEKYDSLYVDMDLKVKECEIKLNTLKNNKTKIDNDIWKNNEQQKNINEQIESSLKLQCSLKDEQSEIVNNIDKHQKELCNIIVPSVTVDDIDVSLLTLKAAKSEISNKGNLLGLELEKIHNTQRDIEKQQAKFDSELKYANKEIQRHKDNITKLENREFGQRCTHCGAEVTKENVQHFIDEENLAISVVVKPLTVLDYNKLLEETYEQEANVLEEIDNIKKQIVEIENKQTVLQKQKEDTLSSVVKANICKENLTRIIKDLNTRKDRISFQLKEINVDIKEKQLNELKNNAKELKELIKTNSETEVTVTKDMVIYEFWKQSFSNKGIRPLLLDKFCNSFNQIVKPYCKEVSNGKFNIEFSPTATTRGGQERNKLGLNIVYKDRSVLYHGLSGGERTRINIPLCFGLNKYISNQYNLPSSLLGVMLLDEVFANLDSGGEEDVVHFLNSQSNDKFIGVITHSNELQSYCNNIWNVTKVNDVTRIEVIK